MPDIHSQLIEGIAKLLPLFLLTPFPILGLSTSKSIPSNGIIGDSMLELYVEGAFIRDSSGKTLRLSGVAAHPAHSLELWKGLQEDDVAWMKSKGFTACRLSLTWNEIETSPETYDASYLERYVDNAISLLQKYGIYVILDNHIWNGGPHWEVKGVNGEGVPTFYCDTYSPNDTGLAQFMLDFWADSGQAAEARQALINFWRMLVARYRGKSVVAGYELFNEPNVFPYSIDHIEVIAPQIMDFYNNDLGPAIRQIDPHTILFYDTIYYEASQVPLIYNTKQKLPNVAWARSQYDKSWDYTYDTGRTLDQHKAELQSNIREVYQHFVVDLGAPYFASEFGKGLTELNSLEWVNDTLQFWDMFAKGSFSFQWWRYSAVSPDWMPRELTTGEDRSVVPIIATYASIRNSEG